MKSLFASLLLLFATSSFAQSYMMLPIVEITDGDTIKSNLAWRIPEPLNVVSIRIYGIDTPEMPNVDYIRGGEFKPSTRKAQCIKEADLALAAKAYIENLAIDYDKMKVYEFEWDKYGGRILAKVKIGGINVAKALIEQGLAVEYYGEGPKKDWCE